VNNAVDNLTYILHILKKIS